jgi:hypothetical protein
MNKALMPVSPYLAVASALLLLTACRPPDTVVGSHEATNTANSRGLLTGPSLDGAAVRAVVVAMQKAKYVGEMSGLDQREILGLLDIDPERFATSRATITNALAEKAHPYKLTEEDFGELARQMLEQPILLDTLTTIGAEERGRCVFARITLDGEHQSVYFVKIASGGEVWRMCGTTTRAF